MLHGGLGRAVAVLRLGNDGLLGLSGLRLQVLGRGLPLLLIDALQLPQAAGDLTTDAAALTFRTGLLAAQGHLPRHERLLDGVALFAGERLVERFVRGGRVLGVALLVQALLALSVQLRHLLGEQIGLGRGTGLCAHVLRGRVLLLAVGAVGVLEQRLGLRRGHRLAELRLQRVAPGHHALGLGVLRRIRQLLKLGFDSGNFGLDFTRVEIGR